MNILVIGSGGREHALVWKIAQSPLVDRLYCAPGNAGIAKQAACLEIGVMETERLVSFAKDNDIELTVVAPEDPLAKGTVDRFAEAGLKAFGPTAAAARLESSKVFAKEFMLRHGIPAAGYAKFGNADDAIAHIERVGAPIVVKADGLAVGKGVTVALDKETAIRAVREAMIDKVFGEAGSMVIVEEFMVGEEASLLAFTDGRSVVPMTSSQDHKPVYDGDTGPNTGGMGAYSPAPVLTPALLEEAVKRVLRPCVEGMAKEGAPFTGCLYAGLMMTKAGMKVVEFNSRFGDPEAQVVLPQLRSDLVPILIACCDGKLADTPVEWKQGACVTVAMASGGYPKNYEKGKVITGIDEAERDPDVVVFHAGTKQEGAALVTNGGRVLNVTAFGPDIVSTIEKAYAAVGKIRFEKAHYRKDIGAKAVARLRTH